MQLLPFYGNGVCDNLFGALFHFGAFEHGIYANIGFHFNHSCIGAICRNGNSKVSPSLYQALGVYLPLITTNCAVLGVAILNIDEGYDLL